MSLRLDVYLHVVPNDEELRLLQQIDHKLDALTEHVVQDPVAIKALADKIAAKTATLKTVVDAAATPTAP
jgi:hypothetical protein